jgi:hypothetical protein
MYFNFKMVSTDTYIEIINSITKEQSKIIGKPLALEIAETVPGISFQNGKFIIVGDARNVLIELTNRYEKLLGKVSLKVNEDAISSISSDALSEIQKDKSTSAQ